MTIASARIASTEKKNEAMLLIIVAVDTMLEESFTRGANGGVRKQPTRKSPTGPVANLLFSTTAIPTEASADTNSAVRQSVWPFAST